MIRKGTTIIGELRKGTVKIKEAWVGVVKVFSSAHAVPADGVIYSTAGVVGDGVTPYMTWTRYNRWEYNTSFGSFKKLVEGFVFNNNTTTLYLTQCSLSASENITIRVDNTDIYSAKFSTVKSDRAIPIPQEFLDGNPHSLSFRTPSQTFSRTLEFTSMYFN